MRLQVRYNFYPRPPRGGRPHHGEGHLRQPDFYPRPPRGGRRACWAATRVPALISIHALREEGDARQSRSTSTAEISIHALREEGDIFASCFSVHCIQFLSTPSARRATRAGSVRGMAVNLFLSTPSARRATFLHSAGVSSFTFLSTPSARRATRRALLQRQQSKHFYPRPPRGGRRATSPSPSPTASHFYPRPPRGGRLMDRQLFFDAAGFLSTPSVRRATFCGCPWRG